MNKSGLTAGNPRSPEKVKDHGRIASFMSSGALPVRSVGPPDRLALEGGELVQGVGVYVTVAVKGIHRLEP